MDSGTCFWCLYICFLGWAIEWWYSGTNLDKQGCQIRQPGLPNTHFLTYLRLSWTRKHTSGAYTNVLGWTIEWRYFHSQQGCQIHENTVPGGDFHASSWSPFFFFFRIFHFFEKEKKLPKRGIFSVFDYNFWYNRPTTMILVSTPIFSGTGNQLVIFPRWSDQQGCQIRPPGLPNSHFLHIFGYNGLSNMFLVSIHMFSGVGNRMVTF